MATNPVLTTKLSGTEIVNGFTRNKSWTAKEQIEKVIKIIDTDGEKEINFSDVESINALILKSDNDFVLRFTTSEVAPNEGMIFKGRFIHLEGNTDFLSSLTGLYLSTEETTAIFVDIRVYGA